MFIGTTTAIDTEFTGLSVCPNADQPRYIFSNNHNNYVHNNYVIFCISLFDSLSERYSKVRNTAGHYMICQIGMLTDQ